MSSETFFRSPSEWVKQVVAQLEQRMQVQIRPVYLRCPDELVHTTFSYQVGEEEPVNHFSNDGRHIHQIELRFLIEVPTSYPDFQLEALDASARLGREVMNMNFALSPDLEPAVIMSNIPGKFSPELGVFARVVTIRQQIRMGDVQNFWHMIVGTELNGKSCNTDSTT